MNVPLLARVRQALHRFGQSPVFIPVKKLAAKFFNEEMLRLGMEGLANHKLRSLLTMLGIIFGVAAVISMLAIGEGARRKSLAQIQALGLQNIIVKNLRNVNEQGKNAKNENINLGDLEAVKNIIRQAKVVVPVVENEYPVSYKNRHQDLKISGSTEDYFKIFRLRMDKGGFFNRLDNAHYQRVCILGRTAARDLFVVENPLDKMIKIGFVWFRVIGVLDYHPISTAGSEEVNLNDHIFLPIKSAMLRLPADRPARGLDEMIVQIGDEKQIPVIAGLIDRILYRRHNQQKSYHLIVPEQLLQQSAETQRIFNIVMGAIAGISLLVGGIGIMNIMLASVLERTREIGIRRSIGATKMDIRNQFLIEAVFLSLAGGIIGILLGYLLAFGITMFSDWETAVSWWSVILSFGVSSAVGIIFGYYPARKAAELNPIEALRYE